MGLGSNLGNREEYLYNALRLMHYSRAINVVNTSAIYETEPVGVENHADYLNITAEIFTTLNPQQLLDTLQGIEDELGRDRQGELAPRTIDIDILLFGDNVVNSDALIIPHPRMTERKFVLRTLMDIDQQLRHPKTGRTIEEHFDGCSDVSEYRLFRD